MFVEKDDTMVAFIYGLFILFFVVGIFFAAMTLFMIYLAKKSKSWPYTFGEIVSSSGVRRVEIKEESFDKMTFDVYYEASIEYEYIAGGMRQKCVIPIKSGNLASAQSRVDAYPVGKRIHVYYDPLHPDLSVLERGLISELSQLKLGLVSAICLMLFGLTGIIFRFPERFVDGWFWLMRYLGMK